MTEAAAPAGHQAVPASLKTDALRRWKKSGSISHPEAGSDTGARYSTLPPNASMPICALAGNPRTGKVRRLSPMTTPGATERMSPLTPPALNSLDAFWSSHAAAVLIAMTWCVNPGRSSDLYALAVPTTLVLRVALGVSVRQRSATVAASWTPSSYEMARIGARTLLQPAFRKNVGYMYIRRRVESMPAKSSRGSVRKSRHSICAPRVRYALVRTRGRSAVTATLPKNLRRERRPIGF